MVERELNTAPVGEHPAMPPTQPGKASDNQPPGFLQTVAEVIREHPGGFISAALDLVLGRGKFTKEN